MKLQSKIILFQVAILVSTILVTTCLATDDIVHRTKSDIEKNLLNTAEAIACMSEIAQELQEPPQNGLTQKLSSSLLSSIIDVDLIVVCNMQGIRYSHPNPDLIGLPMIGGDEERALRGEKYLSTATGTLGPSIRAFVPIYSEKPHVQVGYVVVGTLYKGLKKQINLVWRNSFFYAICGLFIGIVGSVFLTEKLKKILLNLEPEEIAKMNREYRGMLDALHEGVIAIDNNHTICLTNNSAKKLLFTQDTIVEGKDIRELMPTTRLPLVFQTGQPEYDQEQMVNGHIIITNRVPIKEKGKIVGAVATFRDKTMLVRLGSQLTGAHQMIESLRTHSHDFMNKLHVILGLLELNEADEAKNYIADIIGAQNTLQDQFLKNINESVVAGLIQGKMCAGKEQQVKVTVHPDSKLDSIEDETYLHLIVTIIGNLLDNAIEATRECPNQQGLVEISLLQHNKSLDISVTDNGEGIPEQWIPQIFNAGFSTKGNNRGRGLAVIYQSIKTLGGSLTYDRIPSNDSKKYNTIFSVLLPEHGGNNSDSRNDC